MYKAKQELWVIGDDFVAKHMRKLLIKQPQNRNSENFTVSTFDVHTRATVKMIARNTNLLSRMRNSLVHLINKYGRLPKFIVVIPEADIIDDICYTDFGVSTAYGKAIDWLLNEFNRIITAFKDKLPEKCRNVDEPHFIWIQTTRHVNYIDDEARGKFNNVMRVLASTQPNTAVYFLQQLWERKNNNFVLPHNGLLTFTGITTIWAAIDRTIKYGVAKYHSRMEKAKIAHIMQNRNPLREKENRRDRDNQPHDRSVLRLPPPPTRR